MLISPLTFKEFDENNVTNREIRKERFAKPKKEEEDLPPPPPTFSEEELNNARQEGYKQGFLDGTKEGENKVKSEQADVERILMEGLGNLTQAFPPIFGQYRAHCLKLTEDMPLLALSIAKKIAKQALLENYQNVISNAARHCANLLISEEQVIISMNQRVAKVFEDKIKNVPDAEEIISRIKIVGDEAIAENDYNISWKNGSIEHSQEKLWSQVEKFIDDMIAGDSIKTNEQVDSIENEVVQQNGGNCDDGSDKNFNDVENKE
ncbi:MAG: FliH/SctL family protein [Rickettsiales bacterium]